MVTVMALRLRCRRYLVDVHAEFSTRRHPFRVRRAHAQQDLHGQPAPGGFEHLNPGPDAVDFSAIRKRDERILDALDPAPFGTVYDMGKNRRHQLGSRVSTPLTSQLMPSMS